VQVRLNVVPRRPERATGLAQLIASTQLPITRG